MSFGFSIGDIILLTQLTTRAYNGWKNACGEYADITSDLAVLQTLLSRIQAEVEAPNSVFTQHPDDIRGWETISKSCYSVVKELDDVLKKYKSLSRSRSKNWDRIRLGNKNLDSLSTQLLKRISSLTAFASVLGVSSQGRLESEAFPKLLKRIDGLAAQIRKGNATISTALSSHENDDKEVWREFRRDMIGAGIRSSDIRRYSPALKTYITRLQREGLLDEEVPVAPNEKRVAEPNQEEFFYPDQEESSHSSQDLPQKDPSSSQTQPDTHLETAIEVPVTPNEGAVVEPNQEESSRPNRENSAKSNENEPQKYLLSSQIPYNIQLKTSEELARERLETQKSTHGLDHLETIATMNKLAGIYWEQYRWEEAEVLYRQIMETRIKELGPEHPDTLEAIQNLGILLLNLRRLEEAEDNLRELMRTQSRVLGREHRTTLKTISGLAEVYLFLRRYKECETLAQQMMEAQERVLGENHLQTLWTMHILGCAYDQQGQLGMAEDLMAQTLAREKKALGANHANTLATMALLSSMYRDQGRLQEAEELGQQCLEGYKKTCGLDDIWTLDAMHILARTFKAQGRISEAISLLEDCLKLQEKSSQVHQDTKEERIRELRRWRDKEKTMERRLGPGK